MKKNDKFQFGNILTVSFAHLLHDIYSSFLAPILPLLIDKLSISYTLAGFLSVAQRIPSLLNPFIGIIADRFPVRYFIIAAPSLTAVSMSLLGAAPHYTALVILLLMMGISAALFHVPAPVMIKHTAGDRIGKGMSFYMLGGEIARTLGPLIILGAISLWGLEGTYRLIPFGLIVSFVLYLKVRNIKISDDFKKNGKKYGANQTFIKLLPFFSTLAGITFFRASMKAALTTFLPTYLTVQGDSLWAAGISLSILQLAGAAGTLFCGSISDRIGRRTTLLIVSIVSPLFMWLFIVLDGIFTIPLLIIIGFVLFATGPVMLAVVQDINSERPAFVNGIYMTINFLIGALAVMIIGILADWIGLENTFKIAALLSIGSIPFVMKLSNKKSNTSLN
jgi:FSR family fosmidomycin resistance protein-like MFS transporter